MRFVSHCKINERPPYPAPACVDTCADERDSPNISKGVTPSIPPGSKRAELGIRHVAPETVEAAQAFGSTRAQTIRKVQLPLALPSIMLGVNQMIMMVLAMVIIAGLVGSGALGLEAITGLRRVQTGRGIEAGLAKAPSGVGFLPSR